MEGLSLYEQQRLHNMNANRAFLATLNPELDADDRASLDNAKKLGDFLLKRNANGNGATDLTALAPRAASASVIRQLAALSPLVAERQADLRAFGLKLAARLAEKQTARTVNAFADLIAPQPPAAVPTSR